jgi:tetratricopeptide (TPR) repeat protein
MIHKMEDGPRDMQSVDIITNARKTIEVEPDNAEAHFQFARLLEHEGKLEDARMEFAMAGEKKNDFVDAFVCLANLLSRTGHYQEAENQYKKAIGIDPHHYFAHFSYAVMLEELKRFGEAEDEYIAAAKLRAGR